MNRPGDKSSVWWDRDVDDRGSPIRADVREAARQLWPEAIKRVRRRLSDSAEAAQLMESAVAHISRHLNRFEAPPFGPNVPSLLSLHFSQRLSRLASRLERITSAGDCTGLENYAAIEGWTDRIDRNIDLERVLLRLNPRSRAILVMRMHGYDWETIGRKLGVLSSTARRAFWKDTHTVLTQIMLRNGTGRP
jgi:DNA-directed RNA polymerase specialized sigma24 family protein